MKIFSLTVGMIDTNCYVIKDDATSYGVVIDPGDDAGSIVELIGKEGITEVKYILDTHGHIDHVRANITLREITKAPILIHNDDVELLANGTLCGADFLGVSYEPHSPDGVFEDGGEIVFGETALKVIHTPGHTRGGVCFLHGTDLFAGDTVFRASIGRTDLPGGDFDTLITSIRNKIFCLPDQTRIYPGHGLETTVGFEKQHNPFLS